MKILKTHYAKFVKANEAGNGEGEKNEERGLIELAAECGY